MVLSMCHSCTAASLHCESTDSTVHTSLQHALLDNGQMYISIKKSNWSKILGNQTKHNFALPLSNVLSVL